MRNIFLLLSCLLCLQACKDDDKDMDWTPDALTISCNETLVEAGSGNWKVTLPTEYKGSVKLDIQTDKAWEVEVTYMTTEEDRWITPSVNAGDGSAVLTLAIADNNTAQDRKASVVITTKGNIPVKKTVTVIQGNINELLVVETIDEKDFPEEDMFITTGTDGSFAVTLPKDFTENGERQLDIITYQGTATPEVEITYPEDGQQDWVILTQNMIAPISESETKILALTIKENEENAYREAFVHFTATAGGLTTKKTVQIIQFGVEEVIWNEVYYQQEREFIVSSDAQERILVATCKNMNPADIEVSGGTAWLSLTQEDGKVYAKVVANETTNTEYKTEISVKNKKTGTTEKISFKQGMKGYGIALSKALWNVPVYSEVIDKQYSANAKSRIKQLYDNDWADATHNPYVEFNGGLPYMFTFDLGENHHAYDSFGIMPRLQWTQPAPKTVKIEVSDELDNGWVTVIEEVPGNGFIREELEYEGPYNTTVGNKYNNHYEGIVKWFKLNDAKIQKRYIRLTISETHNGKVLCLDEVFVADRTNVQ